MNRTIASGRMGFGLLAIMIAMGIASVGGYALLSLANQSQLAQRNVSQSAQIQEIHSQIQLVLQNESLCTSALKGLSIPVTGNEKATATLALEQGLSLQALTIAKPGMTRGGVRVDQMTLELPPETGAEGSLKSPQQLLILRVAISKTGAGLGSRSTSHEFPFMVTLNAAMSAVESCSIPSAQMMSVDLGTLSNYLPAGYFSGITIPKEDGSGNLLLSGNSLTWGPQNTPAIDYDLTQSPADNQYQMRGLQCGMLSAGIGKFLFDTACSRYCTQICTSPRVA